MLEAAAEAAASSAPPARRGSKSRPAKVLKFQAIGTPLEHLGVCGNV